MYCFKLRKGCLDNKQHLLLSQPIGCRLSQTIIVYFWTLHPGQSTFISIWIMMNLLNIQLYEFTVVRNDVQRSWSWQTFKLSSGLCWTTWMGIILVQLHTNEYSKLFASYMHVHQRIIKDHTERKDKFCYFRMLPKGYNVYSVYRRQGHHPPFTRPLVSLSPEPVLLAILYEVTFCFSFYDLLIVFAVHNTSTERSALWGSYKLILITTWLVDAMSGAMQICGALVAV
jgi:hypothetical protein